ncbi:MAG: transketolase [Elusimicrobia bacterium RIFOXYA2_FULL_39_19]|nr:MAG: transketolase [Elusimicrobia bacterium RIFOXYA2_FULL_39_19]
MSLINSKTSEVRKDYSISELIEKSKEMRAWNMIGITLAKSGHTGGTMSIMDITAALYLKIMKHDPENPIWEDRDRTFWSTGHKAPALYVALGAAGYYNIEETAKLRRLWSGFEGHPNRFKLPGIELSSGSLGQGLGVAVGSAINAKLEKQDYRVYCIMGDGEQQEGSIWESVMSAAHYKLDNLVGILDRNKLQIDGKVADVMNVEPLEDKYKSFGWNVIVTNGHDMQKIVEAFEQAKTVKGQPTVIIFETVKGKGICYAENVAGYHGVPPKHGRCGDESLESALKSIGIADKFPKERLDAIFASVENYQKGVNKKVEAKLPKFKKNYWWNADPMMKVDMEPTRFGFGKALEIIGEDKNVVAHGSDITSSIKMDDFYKNHPERKNRFFSMGIAEQNMTVVAAGLAKEGKTAFIGSYGVFVTGRNWDQIRTTLCYNDLNVKIASAHAGISVGQDGATHQALEEIALMAYLPKMTLTVPCDSIETEKATHAMAIVKGPSCIRYAREATPIATKKDTPFVFGKANVIRFRKVTEKFVDAFEIKLAEKYKSEKEQLTIIACGPMVPEAMRAAWILKEQFKIEARVLNVHTVKPLDVKAILKAAEETGAIVTAEEHQAGGLGNIIAGAIARNKKYKTPLLMDMIGINDTFGDSGQPWELMKIFGLTAEFFVERARKIVAAKKK